MSCFIFSIYFSVKMEVLPFHLAASERNGICVRGNKSRMPGGFIAQTVPGLLLLLCQQMQKYSLHAWGVLSGSLYWSGLSYSTACIDHIDCLFFLKSVMRRTLCQVSCQTQVCMMLRSNQHGLSFCSFPPLQIYCVETCNILFSWINLSCHSSHISSVILYSHYKKYSFRLKQKPHLNTSSLFEEDGSTVVYTGYLSHLAQFLQNKWHLFIWFLIQWRSCCHVHQQTQGGIVSSHLTDWLTCYQSALACFLIWSVI